MTITIPMWIWYALGGVAFAGLLVLAALGVVLLLALGSWGGYR